LFKIITCSVVQFICFLLLICLKSFYLSVGSLSIKICLIYTVFFIVYSKNRYLKHKQPFQQFGGSKMFWFGSGSCFHFDPNPNQNILEPKLVKIVKKSRSTGGPILYLLILLANPKCFDSDPDPAFILIRIWIWIWTL
jgi:hypothetical protein